MTNYPKYFRVPDLRAKFISYCNAASSLNSLDEEAYDIHQHKSEEWNTTGLYTPDNSPLNPILQNQEVGEHFHFLAYGTYNGYNTAGRNSNMYNFKTYTVNNGCDGIKSSSIWYLQTSAGSVSYPDGEGGYSYGFGCSGNRRRGQSSVDSITACAYVSAPSGGQNSYLIEPTLGLTSKSIPIYQIPNSNEETYKKTEYEEWSDYNNLKSGISKNIIHLELDKDSILPQRYGFENAPKFYTFLPLIRI